MINGMISEVHMVMVKQAKICYLFFLSMKQLCAILGLRRKATWQHPGTKQWHCIDFMFMRRNQCLMCLDASVMMSVTQTMRCCE